MHVCLFDIDGTLIHSGGAGQAAIEDALASEFGIEAPTSGISTAGRTDRAITHDIAEFHGLGTDAATLARFAAAYLSHLPGRLREREGTVLPGILEILNALSRRSDVVLGLLTGNLLQGARLKLEYYGIHEYFEFGGYGDVHHDRSDVARAALAAAETHLAAPPTLSKTWVIGDTAADVICGRAIGGRVVGVATGVVPRSELEAAEPDHLFEDFSNPSALLALLE